MIGRVAASQVNNKQPLDADLTSLATNPQAYDAYSSGTVYQLTATPAALDFGTTDPQITLAVAGTYRVRAQVVLKYNAATLVANRNVTIKIRRTNNTPADLTNGSVVVVTGAVTSLTQHFALVVVEVVYVATAGDILTIFGDISIAPSAGSLDADAASIHAQRIAA